MIWAWIKATDLSHPSCHFVNAELSLARRKTLRQRFIVLLDGKCRSTILGSIACITYHVSREPYDEVAPLESHLINQSRTCIVVFVMNEMHRHRYPKIQVECVGVQSVQIEQRKPDIESEQ